MRVQSLGWEDPLEESMATPFIILVWRIPWTEEPGGLRTVHGVAQLEMTEETQHTRTKYCEGMERET